MDANTTYVAFDATGVADHENSNLPVFRMLERWAEEYPRRYRFINMDDIDFSSQHEDFIDSTLKMNLLRKMVEADNLLVLASKMTNVESPILNWQISKGVNRFHLPVVVAYVGLADVDEKTVDDNYQYLPNKVRKYLGRDSAPMVHIPLTRDKLERALSAFSVKGGRFPWHSKTIF